MEAKIFLGCAVLIVVLAGGFGETCPSRWDNRSDSCRRGSRCSDDKQCSDGQICCRVWYCGSRCRDAVMPVVAPVKHNIDKAVNIDDVSEVSPQETTKKDDVRHGGRCDRSSNINCAGASCAGDGSCLRHQKCCTTRCGNKLCASALRSSIFSIFSGK